MAGSDDLRQLAADLAKGVDLGEVRGVVHKGAVNIKTQLREEASASRHFKMAQTITFDEIQEFGGPAAEIGPVKKGAGNLANIAYFGGTNGGGGTVPDPNGALSAEEPRFIEALAALADRIL